MIERRMDHFALIHRGEYSPMIPADAQAAFHKAQCTFDGREKTPEETTLLESSTPLTWAIETQLPNKLHATMRIGYTGDKPELRFGIVAPRELKRAVQNNPALQQFLGSVTFTEGQEPKTEGSVLEGTTGTFIRSVINALLEANPTDLLIQIYN